MTNTFSEASLYPMLEHVCGEATHRPQRTARSSSTARDERQQREAPCNAYVGPGCVEPPRGKFANAAFDLALFYPDIKFITLC